MFLMRLTDKQKDQIISILDSDEFKNNLYEGLVEEERSAKGQFYTPGKICIKMIEKFKWDTLSGKTILDPTVGSGNLLIACLIAGADSDKIFGNEYDADIIPTCRNRINKVCDLLDKPHIKDWQIHQGNALHRFAITYFGEDYEEMYFDGKTQPAARNKKLNNESYDAYLQSNRFKKKYPELYKEELSLNLNTIQKKQAEATGSFDLFGGLF